MPRQSTTFNYLTRTFDFTDLERLPTDTGIDLIDALNTAANEQAERLELLFTEIACDIIDNPSHSAIKKPKRRRSYVKVEKLQETNELTKHFDARDTEEVNEVIEVKTTEQTEVDDDFDETNPNYLAILNEVKGA